MGQTALAKKVYCRIFFENKLSFGPKNKFDVQQQIRQFLCNYVDIGYQSFYLSK